ncbi:bifunctional riboflavin kinase/FAD synthetase [Bdellovibrionota bacterium FG-1]
MELIHGIQHLTKSLPHPVLTIGNFDGVHLGHQHIIRLAVEKARVRGGIAVAYTFRPHPQVALRPAAEVQLLNTYDEKLELLAKAGLDCVIEEPFSREFSTVAPHEFFTDVILRRLSAEAIVVGYDFAFGKERAGTLEALEEFCRSAGVELVVVAPHRIGAEVVSSSRIRQHLRAGEIELANALLGREFFYRGIVVKGEGRGRKIGFPTANLRLENKLTLPYGVYATRAVLEGQSFASVTNIGVRPTFQGEGPELPALVETHLLNTTIDLYGKELEVRFVRRLRDERRFSGMAELKTQIDQDAKDAGKVLVG